MITIEELINALKKIFKAVPPSSVDIAITDIRNYEYTCYIEGEKKPRIVYEVHFIAVIFSKMTDGTWQGAKLGDFEATVTEYEDGDIDVKLEKTSG
ncbi:hypothetical protein AFV9_gp53 [Betalipothrixvirus uzonense]|uniref:Uncharacterized protein n=1 Tax=Betalipothrixvirus uzonense TaxID=512792 RepID=B2CRN0_9VIRU|nr:hypothetical protein AFV9_gp53 [Acidianus filamentous virus 9]ACB37287.1 hypothetical protein [Acidianus filamentous virus 9]